MKHIVTFIDSSEELVINQSFDTRKEAREHIKALIKNGSFSHEDNLKINPVEIISQKTIHEHDEYGGEQAIVYVAALVNKEKRSASFIVQLTSGEYLPQMGCQISTSAGDMEFCDTEKLIFNALDVAKIAEKAAAEETEENYEFVDAGFNCAINSVDLKIRVCKNSGKATLIHENYGHNKHDYSTAFSEGETFETLALAEEFLDQYKTDEYSDFSGLSAYFNENA
ncbi:MAG TPA: hypothetical protein DIW64_18870 [Cellvibrio sp.]|nr:hypothetical protein [Cellvibrio sp.]